MLIIIIGLPCAGKTSYIKNNFFDYLIYDDFITSYNGEIVKKLKLETNVVIADPRLCNIVIFNKYYNLFSKYIQTCEIEIHILTTTVDICIERNKIRKLENNIDVHADILKLSKLFDIRNYTKYKHVLIDNVNKKSN